MIAVTGAAGFIGSNLAHRLSSLDHELVLIDSPPTPQKQSHWNGLRGYSFIPQDAFPDWLREKQPKLNAVFHLGACSSTTERNWDYLRTNNVEYSQTLWDWCAEAECPFVYASSAATYGDGSRGFDDRTPPKDLYPLNLYGRSKNDFDIWVMNGLQQGRAAPPRWAGVKFFNVYGPREGHKGSMISVVWQAHRQIQEKGVVRLFKSNDFQYPDGGQTRDFVYVEDCIDHMLWLWRSSAASGIYNSGTATPRTFLDLAYAVFSAMDRKPNIEFFDMPESLSAQYQNYTCASMEKLRETGFPKIPTSLEEGVARTLQAVT